MQDVGEEIKREEMYPTMEKPGKKEIRYPSFDLPLKVVKGMDIEVDDEVTITVKGRISGLQDTKWTKAVTIEAHQAEVTKDKKPTEK